MNDEQTSKAALGFLSNRTVRPTYAINVSAAWRDRSRFPKSNRIWLADCEMRWKIGVWSRIEFDSPIQSRDIRIAVFDREELICFIQAMQTRPMCGTYMHIDAFFDWCDAVSQHFCDHATAAKIGLQKLLDQEYVSSEEPITEFMNLFVAKTHLSRRIWADAIQAMMRRLSWNCQQERLYLLQAVPLEMAWRNGRLSALKDGLPPNGRDEGVVTQASLAEVEALKRGLRDRRYAALQRLYARELGFTSLNDMSDFWMARVYDPYVEDEDYTVQFA